tara:strand:- start:3209 stop:4612 length:1404 start_codon:yes stop_codon:yes gene_type:complete
MSKKRIEACRALFKEIPSIDDLYQALDIKNTSYPRSEIKSLFRKKLSEIRKDIESEKLNSNIRQVSIDIIKTELAKLTSFNLSSVINGTGIVLHTGLGRAPISKDLLLESFNRLYPYSNLEFNVKSNKRGDRNDSIQNIINPLLGSNSALVVNNCAAAVLLSLNTFSENKEVIVSRGQQVEIGGSFRIPEVISKAGCIMKDVGATNKTYTKDYQKAINKDTGAILYAHTSNYRVIGFTKEIDIDGIGKIAQKSKVPFIVDAGSGCIALFEKFNMPSEKTVKGYFKKGADIVMFSGDKLLGGPQCGIIAGKKKYIEMIKENPLYRALRVDKLTLSLLESTLRTYISETEFDKMNLSLNLLTRNRVQIKDFGNLVLKNIPSEIVKKYNIELMDTMVEAGSGAMPINSLESAGLTFDSKNISPNALSKKFRNASIPVIGYINDNKYIIDLKAIPLDFADNLSNVICEVML